MEICSKNGVKRDGESCTLNNNCIYPNCMEENVFPIEELEVQRDKVVFKKFAEKWAEEWLNSEDGKLEIEKLHKESMDFILYGKLTSYLDERLLEKIKNFKDGH